MVVHDCSCSCKADSALSFLQTLYIPNDFVHNAKPDINIYFSMWKSLWDNKIIKFGYIKYKFHYRRRANSSEVYSVRNLYTYFYTQVLGKRRKNIELPNINFRCIVDITVLESIYNDCLPSIVTELCYDLQLYIVFSPSYSLNINSYNMHESLHNIIPYTCLYYLSSQEMHK